MTGSEVTTVTGNMLAQGFPATEGTITVTSTLQWENQPVTCNFKQASIAVDLKSHQFQIFTGA